MKRLCQLTTGVARAVVFAGLGWNFVPALAVYAPSGHGAMPMGSFIYVSQPTADNELDTATAGHLLAVAMEQFALEPGRTVYMVSQVLSLPCRGI